MGMKNKLLSNHKAVKQEDNAFEAFKKRFHFILGDQLDITDGQLKQIYDGISSYIETSIYAEMEEVMVAIHNAYLAVIGWITERTAENPMLVGIEEHQSEGKIANKDDLQRYMNHEKSFDQFLTHVVTNYNSLPKQRIDILMFKHEGYQRLELQLFNESFIQQHGFRKAYHFHNELVQAYYTAFDNVLFEGTVLKSDQEIEEQVLEPVLERFEAIVDAKVGDGHEQAESL